MTPLAHYLTRQLLKRPNERAAIWRHSPNVALLKDALSGVHCFEITGAIPLMQNLADDVGSRDLPERAEISERLCGSLAFLPATKTWIEWLHGSGNRVAYLLEDCGDRLSQFSPHSRGLPEGGWLRATFFCRELAQSHVYLSSTSGDFYDGDVRKASERYIPDYLAGDRDIDTVVPGLLAFLHIALIVINSPRIIAQATHNPHRGLARQVARARDLGFAGLNPWTEIKLQITKPREISDGEPHEDQITGKRALHFCRKRLRILQSGKLTYVREHWRGDPTPWHSPIPLCCLGLI